MGPLLSGDYESKIPSGFRNLLSSSQSLCPVSSALLVSLDLLCEKVTRCHEILNGLGCGKEVERVQMDLLQGSIMSYGRPDRSYFLSHLLMC